MSVAMIATDTLARDFILQRSDVIYFIRTSCCIGMGVGCILRPPKMALLECDFYKESNCCCAAFPFHFSFLNNHRNIVNVTLVV
ncbi:hypothetical protein ES319_A03G045300v1 [Gossypium barbadense]|uniref:Uncharacterized protein n=1 Tax=Gossypium barbadense TaxID=3634 RepID=A0A5J5WAN6_GOSBA|nr:hypothetical protein ES319_A03G045300v1 [Gossypium barbadense]